MLNNNKTKINEYLKEKQTTYLPVKISEIHNEQFYIYIVKKAIPNTNLAIGTKIRMFNIERLEGSNSERRLNYNGIERFTKSSNARIKYYYRIYDSTDSHEPNYFIIEGPDLTTFPTTEDYLEKIREEPSGGKSKKKSLDKCTVAELKERAQKRSIKVSGLKKAEIINKLRNKK